MLVVVEVKKLNLDGRDEINPLSDRFPLDGGAVADIDRYTGIEKE